MSERSRNIDNAAFGVIYGSITVMGVLAATDPTHFDPLTTGLTLFVTVLAIAMAKTYAELAAEALASGAGQTKASVHSAWQHSRTTLIAANGPTLVMFAGAAGLFDNTAAMMLAQACTVALLLFYGARIGWRKSGRVMSSILSACGLGAGGLALTALKHAVH